MADLHPFAQVAAIISITIVVSIFWISVSSDFFDNIGRK